MAYPNSITYYIWIYFYNNPTRLYCFTFLVLFQYLKLKLSGHDMNEKLQKMVLKNNQYKCDSK